MTQATPAMDPSSMEMHGHSSGVLLRSAVICLTAFLTVVDLFATQAILPSLARAYNVSPAAMGFAVNASTRPVPSPARNIPITVAPNASGSRRNAAEPSATIATNNANPSPNAAIDANRCRYHPAPNSGVLVLSIAVAICPVNHDAASVAHFVI